jgi:hypothetical protein
VNRLTALTAVGKIIQSMKANSRTFGDDVNFKLSFKHPTNGENIFTNFVYMGMSKAPEGL